MTEELNVAEILNTAEKIVLGLDLEVIWNNVFMNFPCFLCGELYEAGEFVVQLRAVNEDVCYRCLEDRDHHLWELVSWADATLDRMEPRVMLQVAARWEEEGYEKLAAHIREGAF